MPTGAAASSGADPAAAVSSDNSAVAGSPITVFDELLSCMGRITLPPTDDSHISASIASQVAIVREKYVNAHNTALASIHSMQSAWSILATVSTGFNSPPKAANVDALKAQIRDLELQLAGSNLALNKTASALQSCDAQFQKLSDAAVSSFRRKNKKFMLDVYNRHVKPIGFSARALVTALHAINPSSFSPEVSDGDAAKLLKELDLSNRGHCDFEKFCTACKMSSDEGAETSPARDVFLRLADIKGLTAQALMDALKEVDAPVLSSSEGCSPEQIFRRADANLSGFVDFAEFMRAAGLPDDIELILDEYRLGNFAPALRAYFTVGDDVVKGFLQLQKEELFAAVDASAESLKQQLEIAHSSIKKSTDATVRLQEAVGKEPTKFSTFKAAGGTVDDFFNGLEDRIGAPNLLFKKAMCAEHTTRGGSTFTFTTGNYKITTQPVKEWLYVVGDGNGHRLECPDKGHGRDIKPIDELMKKPLAIKAELKEYEMIAVVLYTGPMFAIYNAILRRYPSDIYEVYKTSDNLFSTTIFVLVSAIQKLSRCMNIPVGALLYRGLGGSMELPDTFFVPSELCVPSRKCKTPNALGYTEFAFMSTTQDRSVAVQYSGVRDNKPKASIMEFHPNSVDRGADISEFSQYPAEQEFLIVPCSFVQGQGRQRTEITDGGGVLTVISASVNINLKTETVEQLLGKKKSMHIAAFDSLIDETKQYLQEYAEENGRAQARALTDQGYLGISVFIQKIIKLMQKMKDEDYKLPDDDYVNDRQYKALVTRMLSTQAWAKEALWLWLENEDTTMGNRHNDQFDNLIKCHRSWLSFLKQRKHAVAVVGSDDRKSAAIRILQCKGLMVSDDALTEEVSGEPLIFAAAADGWALDDVELLLDAGASPTQSTKRYPFGLTAMHAASKMGDLRVLETLLKAKADINQVDGEGRHAIFEASDGNHASVIEWLVSKSADVNCLDNRHFSPMHWATAQGSLSAIKCLVSHRANVNVLNKGKYCPLYWAAYQSTTSAIAAMEYIIDHGADVNTVNYDGTTPLIVAASSNVAVVKLLLKHGANMYAFREDGCTPLDFAFYDKSPTIECFMAYGADINMITNGNCIIHRAVSNPYSISGDRIKFLFSLNADVNARDKDGATPIFLAVSNYRNKAIDASVIELLLAHDADVNAVNKDGRAPIHSAAFRGDSAIIELLLTYKADVNARRSDGLAPIHEAACKNDASIIELLLRHNADLNARDVNDGTPIHSAASQGHSSVVTCLVTHNADVNAVSKDGRAPIHSAAVRGDSTIIELLLTHKADVNARRTDGLAPIHEAACKNDASIIELLLRHNADLNARNQNGFAPIHQAASQGHSSIITCLVTHNADVNSLTETGASAVRYAAANNRRSCIETLVLLSADVNICTTDGKSPLERAREQGHTECVAVLEACVAAKLQ